MLAKLLLKTFANSAAIFMASKFVEGFTMSDNLFILAGIGLVLAIFQSFVYPVIKILAFPVVLLSFGLFGTVVNMAVLWLIAYYVPDLTIDGIVPLIWGTAIVSVANFLFAWL